MGANYGSGNYGQEFYSAPYVGFAGNLVVFVDPNEPGVGRIRQFSKNTEISVSLSAALSQLYNLSGTAVATLGLSAALEAFRGLSGTVVVQFALQAAFKITAVFGGQIFIEPVVRMVPEKWDNNSDGSGTWVDNDDPVGPWIDNSDSEGAWVNG